MLPYIFVLRLNYGKIDVELEKRQRGIERERESEQTKHFPSFEDSQNEVGIEATKK